MAYSTLAMLKDLIEERTLLELTDDENAGAFANGQGAPTPASGRVDAAIASGDRVIDSYLSSRYSVPLATVPGLIADISANLALCNLFERRHQSKAPEGLAARRRNNIALLESIQKGTALIPSAEQTPPADVQVSRTADDEYFSDAVLGAM